MKKKYTFLAMALDVLNDSDKPLTVDQIWNAGIERGLVERLGSSGKTPTLSLRARLYTDIKNKKSSHFCVAGRNPVTWGLKKKKYAHPVAEIKNMTEEHHPEVTTKTGSSEKDLHILLATFVRSAPQFQCHAQTIHHESSRRGLKGFNEWLHPDMVGVYFPFNDFHKTTVSLLDALKDHAYKIFSFELKQTLYFGNLRESYFQAVSNSSWAHEGYLVTLEIEDDGNLINELRRLNNAFGIGVIKLDPVNVDQSDVLFPAHFRTKLDWQTIDRLMEENPEFHTLFVNVMEDIKIRNVKSKYDKILDLEDVEEYSKSKGLIPEDL